MLRTRVSTLVTVVCIAVAATACGDGGGEAGAVEGAGSDTTRPCSPDGQPALVAYNRKTGGVKWAVCASDNVRRNVLHTTADRVYVTEYHGGGPPKVSAYDTATGKLVPGSANPPVPVPSGPHEGTVVDGVRITGGQDDPTSATDEKTGKVLWTQPGSPPYDDVWAIGDGAVFVIDRKGPAQARLVAYEVTSGATRWALDGVNPYGPTMGWPWYAEGKELFTIWSNLAVVSTRDGKTRWHTNYPQAEFPRMTGVRANSDLVFVAFSSVRSGGD